MEGRQNVLLRLKLQKQQNNMKDKMYKLIKVADVRLNMNKFERGEISYTRAVELINEAANKEMQIILKRTSPACL
jgi:hypothetical protein